MADGLGSDPQLDALPQEGPFMQKYLSLRNKCEQLQQGNEKLVNRLHHVKKLVKRYKRERRFLQSRLDNHNDNYREAQVPVMWEEDQMYNLLKPPPLSPPGKDLSAQVVAAATSSSAGVAPLSATKPKPPKKIKTLLKSHDLQATNSSPLGLSHDQKPANLMAAFQPLLLAQSLKAAEHPFAVVKQEPIDPHPFAVVKKEPEPRKRPTNAFLMFCDQYRQSIHNEYLRDRNEIIPQHELTKRLALKWNSLIPADKKVYYDMFEIEKRRLQEVETAAAAAAAAQESEAVLAVMGLESDAAVSSLLKQEPP